MLSAVDSPATPWSLGLIGLNVLLEQLGMPLPAAPALMLAGSLSGAHELWAAAVLAAAIGICIITDVGWYMSGRRYGGRIMRLLCRISISPDSCVRDTQTRFESWGAKVLLVAKFIPGLSLISPPLAGALRMPLSSFVLLSALGSTLWVGTFFALGALLRPEIEALRPYLHRAWGRALVGLAVLLAAYLLFKWWRRWRLIVTLRMARIEVSELATLLQQQRPPLVLDVRSHTAYALEPRAIPSSLHVPPDEVHVHLRDVERDREVILYCSCPNEASAARVAQLLLRLGFRRVRPLLGGLDAWIAAGYPYTKAAAAAQAPAVLTES